MRVLNQTTQKKPQYLPQITQIYADEPQNHKTTLTTQNCLSLRNNAACCIPLCVICVISGRITRKSTQSIHINETPVSLADLADNRRRNPREHIYFIRYYEKEIIMDTAIKEKPLPSRGKVFERHTRLCESPFNDS